MNSNDPQKKPMCYIENTSDKESPNHSNIKKAVIRFGVPVNIIGYRYIVEAINQLIENKNTPVTLKDIYENIASKSNILCENVEINIRNAVRKSHIKKTAAYEEVFKDFDKTPSNSTFLKTLSEHVLICSEG